MSEAEKAGEEAVREIMISPRARVSAQLTAPEDARAVVVLARAGDEVASARIDALARALRQEASVATVVLDLVAAEELAADAADSTRLPHRVPVLAERMSGAADFAGQDQAVRHLPLAFVASGVAAAAAMLASTTRPAVKAIVSIDGHPELATDALETVVAPTLFLVDERDDTLLGTNRSARARLRAKSELAILPGGPPGSSPASEVLRRTKAWLDRWLL